MFNKLKYIYKLLVSFIITSFIPLIILSIFFFLFSYDVSKKGFQDQAEFLISEISEDLEKLFEEYKHINYILSKNETIIELLGNNQEPDRNSLLSLYQELYISMSGKLEEASAHVISLTNTPSFSTHTLPLIYIKSSFNYLPEIFHEADLTPNKSIIYMNRYINDKGKIINFSICKAITGNNDVILGYVIIDINKSAIADHCNQSNKNIFNDIIIVDTERNICSDLFHPSNDGDFTNLPFLRKIEKGDSGFIYEEKLCVSYMPVLDNIFSITGTTAIDTFLENVNYYKRTLYLVYLLGITVSIILAVIISLSISRPIKTLVTAMEKIEKGDLSIKMKSNRTDEIGLLFKSFNKMVSRIKRLMEKTIEEQKQLRKAERLSLQAQINPHFLYNILNTIKSIAKLNNINDITTIVTHLGKLLRSSIDSKNEITTVRETFELISGYLTIQKIRYGDKLNFEIDIEETIMECRILKLIIQPIVENSIIHGLETKIGKGRLFITGIKDGNEVLFIIKDNGIGIDEKVLSNLTEKKGSIGIMNVQKRIKLYYGEKYGLEIDSEINIGTCVKIRLPNKSG